MFELGVGSSGSGVQRHLVGGALAFGEGLPTWDLLQFEFPSLGGCEEGESQADDGGAEAADEARAEGGHSAGGHRGGRTPGASHEGLRAFLGRGKPNCWLWSE